MTFRVVWSPRARRELEQIWQTAADRDAVLLASWAVEAMLKDDPEGVGESRPDEQRVAFARPLGVLFSVDPAARRVDIGSVWYFRSR